MKNGQVYRILNILNGKSYIGITKRSFKKRYPNIKWYSTASLLTRQAIEKYGIDNFEVHIIEECSVDVLEEREIHWIAFYNTFGANGYNLTSGGTYNKEVSEETKEKISKTKKGYPSHNKGKKMSEERKLQHSKIMKGKQPWNKGKKIGKMTKEHIQKSAKSHYKSVICLDLEGNLIKIYESLKATIEDGFNPAQVCLVCKRKAISHRGFKFEYINN